MYFWSFTIYLILVQCDLLTSLNRNHFTNSNKNTPTFKFLDVINSQTKLIDLNKSKSFDCYKDCDCNFVKYDLNQINSILEINCTNLNFTLKQTLHNLSVQTNVLILSKNNISQVDRANFSKFKNLSKLILTSNLIETIQKDAFDDLDHLETLRISDNYLKEINFSFKNLPSLKYLNIINNQIDSIKDELVFKNSKIEVIELIENPINFFQNDVFSGLSKIRKLTISSIKNLNVFPNLFGDISLEYLTIDRCQLRYIHNDLCKWSPKLVSLVFKSNKLTTLFDLKYCKYLKLIDFSYNFITSLGNNGSFSNQANLLYLFLKNNLIQKLNKFDFKGLNLIQVLNLEDNQIDFIDDKAFSYFLNLQELNLGQNKFKSLPVDGLQELIDLKTYGNINLKEFPEPDKFPKIQKLALSYAYHCCQFLKNEKLLEKNFYFFDSDNEVMDEIIEKITWLEDSNSSHIDASNINESHQTNSTKLRNQLIDNNFLVRKYNIECIPKPSPFMPCEDLFDYWILRCGVWLVFLLAILGNSTVVIVFVFGRTKIDVPRFLVCNLAIADMMMGIYLCILAFVDSATLTMFKMYAVRWQNSGLCSIAGFLAVFSSELSVYTLAVITLERNYAITNAMHLNKRLSLKNAVFIMTFGYIFVMLLAILPITGISSYQKFAVCLPFEIEDYWSRAYVLSLVIFNGLAFLILTGCYLKMYFVIRGSQAWNSNDTRIAKRMALLVFTDFLCWSPVAICTISSVFFNVNLITLSIAKIFTIFILPLNSCANPFLYAIFTKQFKKDCVILCKKLEESRITRGIGGCKHSSNFSNRHTPECTNSIDKYENVVHHQTKIFYTNKNLPKLFDNRNLICDNYDEEDVLNDNFINYYKNNFLSSKNFYNLTENDKLVDLTADYMKNNYEILFEQESDGSRLICKCGIVTNLPKSRLFCGNAQSYFRKKKKFLMKNQSKNSLSKLNQDEKKLLNTFLVNENRQNFLCEKSLTKCNPLINQSILKQLSTKLFNFGKRENKSDCCSSRTRNSLFDNNKNSNKDNFTFNELKALKERKRIESLQLQFIKSKQRLDSISSENFSSRSDSWRQQNLTNLKLLEQCLLSENIRNPNSMIKLDRKNSCTTNSCSTSTFKISRSSVSSDNFKFTQFDKLNQLNKSCVIKEKNLNSKQNKFENLNDKSYLNKKISFVNNSFEAEKVKLSLNDKSLLKQFVCSGCLSKNKNIKDFADCAKKNHTESNLSNTNRLIKNQYQKKFLSTNCLKNLSQNFKLSNLKTRRTKSVDDFIRL